jgi:hypothetical protein
MCRSVSMSMSRLVSEWVDQSVGRSVGLVRVLVGGCLVGQ